MSTALTKSIFQYQGRTVRCGGTKEKPSFVAQDVCEILEIKNHRDAISSLPTEYRGTEVFYTAGGPQSVTVVYEFGLYELIFRSSKPEAQDFKKWVYGVLRTIRESGGYRAKKREEYGRLGRSEDWVEKREQGIEIRKEFTTTLKERGVEGWQYGNCTNAIYRPILGGSASEVKKTRRLPKSSSIRDNLSTIELLKVALSEHVAQERIEEENRRGHSQCWEACKDAGTAIAAACDTRRQIK